MKTFVCTKCNDTVRRPTMPLKCPACGAQGFGVFRMQGGDGSSAPTTVPRPAGAVQPPPPPGIKPPPPATGGAPPAAPPAAAAQPTARPAAPPSAPSPSPPASTPSAPGAPAAPAMPGDAGPVSATPPLPASPSPVAKTAAPEPAPPAERIPEPPPTLAAAPPAANPTPPAAPIAKQPAPTASVSEPPPLKPKAPVVEKQPPAKPAAKPPAVETPPATPAEVTPRGSAPGDVAWQFPTIVPGHDQPHPAVRNGMVVDDNGRIYAALGAKLYAIEVPEAAPQVIWEYETGGAIPGSPVMGRDGRLRVHSGDGKLYCVSAAGETQFAVEVDEPLGWAAPLVDQDNTTWICRYRGGLTNVDNQGNRRASPFFRSRQKFDSTGLIAEGTFFVGSEDGFVFAIKINESRGRNVFDHLRGRGKTDWFINSSPALTQDEQLIVAGRDGFVYSFDLNGVQNWKLAIAGQMLSSPVVAESGRIYVATSLVQAGQPSRGQLLAIDPAAPRVVWEYGVKRQIESVPVIGDDGVIYFGDNAGVIHALNSEGKKQWSSDVGSAVRSAGTIHAPGRILFGLDNGSLVSLVASSKKIASGGWPKSMGNQYNCLSYND